MKSYIGIKYRDYNGIDNTIVGQGEDYLYYITKTGDEENVSIQRFEDNILNGNIVITYTPTVPHVFRLRLGTELILPINDDGTFTIKSYEDGEDGVHSGWNGYKTPYKLGKYRIGKVTDVCDKYAQVAYVDDVDDNVETVFLIEDLLKIINKTQTHGKTSSSSTKTCNQESSSIGVKVSRPIARVSIGERCSGSEISGRRGKVRIAVGHLSYQKINCK